MKTILSTLVAVGVLAGAAHAQTYDPFNDPRQALPRSERISNDDFRAALPRSGDVSGDQFRDAVPHIEDVFPDVTVATP